MTKKGTEVTMFPVAWIALTLLSDCCGLITAAHRHPSPSTNQTEMNLSSGVEVSTERPTLGPLNLEDARRHWKQWNSHPFIDRSSSSSSGRKRRDQDDNNSNTKGFNNVDQNDRLLVQTLNGIVKGVNKIALGQPVDVFLGVSTVIQTNKINISLLGITSSQL